VRLCKLHIDFAARQVTKDATFTHAAVQREFEVLAFSLSYVLKCNSVTIEIVTVIWRYYDR